MDTYFANEANKIKNWKGVKSSGRVSKIAGFLIEASGPDVCLGELCHIRSKHGEYIPCEVVGFREEKNLLMPLKDMQFVGNGAEVVFSGEAIRVGVSDKLLGRVIDALGNPLDSKGDISYSEYYPMIPVGSNPLEKIVIKDPLCTGIKAIDGFCTIGRGQRIGIFSGSGVGKSTLLSMIVKMVKAEVVIFAMIGERGREINEFIEKNLGADGFKNTVIVAVTADQTALLRAKGACVATAIAEYFRDRGKDVVLLMDSVTRYATALREVGIAMGEPPTVSGYTPSVFVQLARLLERPGLFHRGSITGIYTVLVEGDDMENPLADNARAVLDGHIVLSRKLAESNHYPPIDILKSISRVMNLVADKEHLNNSDVIKSMISDYLEAEDMINMGAYVAGSNGKIDRAISSFDKIEKLLIQKVGEKFLFEETKRLMKEVIS